MELTGAAETDTAPRARSTEVRVKKCMMIYGRVSREGRRKGRSGRGLVGLTGEEGWWRSNRYFDRKVGEEQAGCP